jgi:hypothetical protein
MLALVECRWYGVLVATVSEQLRDALARCEATHYAISRATGIPQSVLSRFAGGAGLRSENLDRLAEYLGLVLTPKGAGRTKGGR